MPTPQSIGEAIQNLIREFIGEYAEVPVGMEGLTQTAQDHGLMTFTFEDGSTYRAIIEQSWEGLPPVLPPTDEVEEPPLSGEPEEAEEPPSGS